MNRYVLVTAALLVTILALMAYALQRSYKANGRLAADLVAQQDANEALQELRARDGRVLVARERQRGTRARETALAGASAASAVAANPAWAAQPLPKGVLDALR